MSLETKTALDEAVANHFAEECDGALVNQYALIITGRNIEHLDNGETMYFRVASEDLAIHSALGLHQYAAEHVRAEIRESRDDDDE